MKVFRDLPPLAVRRPCALAIGNFDGVHRGHKQMLAQVREAAARLSLDAAVLTFQPHPREYFAHLADEPSQVPPAIANLRDKLHAFAEAGMNRVIVAHFTAHFASLSEQDFVKKMLVEGLQVKWLIVGEDFCYGAGRDGNVASLQQAGQRYGFQVEVLQDVLHEGERISSSAVRRALQSSDFDQAAALLGQPYYLSGRVIHGEKLGRTLGFPTMNLRIAQRRPVLSGVFVTRVHGLAARPLDAVSCIGPRPSVRNSSRHLLETHVFDFDQICYGKLIRIEFLHKLRDYQKFDGLPALQAAIRRDSENARAFFEKAANKY